MKLQFFQNIIDLLRGKKIRFFGLDPRVKAEKPFWIDSNSTFGDYSVMGKNVNITHSNIGRYVTIEDFVTIGAGEHTTNNISTMLNQCRESLTSSPLTIKNDVWIGKDSIIRRGVTIGNCAVILPNSFVNKDVPDFAIMSGSPAKIIGYRFDEETRKEILSSQYWNYNPTKAKKIIQKLQKKLKKFQNKVFL